jgi:hypothetical protein
MSEKIKPLIPKIASLLRMLTSKADNEVISAAHLLLQALAGAGLDIHALVEWIEQGGDPNLIAAEMQKIWDAGYSPAISVLVLTVMAGSRSRSIAPTIINGFPETRIASSSTARWNGWRSTARR